MAPALLDTVISSEMATGPKVTNEGHLFYILGTVEPLDPAVPEGHLLVGSVRIVIHSLSCDAPGCCGVNKEADFPTEPSALLL